MSKLIAIDNGHGKDTPGKRTPKILNSRVIHEWEFNFPTAKKLGKLLEHNGFKVIYVSDTSVDTPLSTRTSRANNANADLFISIHYNALAGEFGSHGGIETLYHPNSSNGKKLASLVQNELIKETGLRNRGIKARPGLAVLKNTQMPAIICECGFMDNLNEAKLMLDEDYQLKCARAITKGICRYYGKQFKDINTSNPKNDNLYRVRKSWSDSRSQLGAFKSLDNAINLAKKNKGYRVYDGKGNKVYPTNKKTTKPKRTWEYYITGKDVRDLQSELNKQFSKNIKVDGYFGDRTIAALVTVRKGAKGNLTKIIQRRLRSKGFNPSGGIDGIFGNGTYNSIKKFQKANGLVADGIVGQETWKALYRK